MNRACVLMLAILVFGCDAKQESVDFLDPQPMDVSNSKSFNKKYQGLYKSPDDSSALYITTDKIIKIFNIPFVFSRNDVDSSFKGDRNNNDQLKDSFAKDNIKINYFKGDSVYSTWIIRDTLFTISDHNFLRFFKGAYFLNYTDNHITWKVQRLDLHKKRLSFAMIMPYDSLFKATPLKEKIEIKDDSGSVVQYQIRPTKKELKNLIREKTFHETVFWIKE
jgi:hypothetical protein